MGSRPRYEVELTIISAENLKNVSWQHGDGKLKPYAVAWVDPDSKCSSHVDEKGDMSPYWDENLIIPFQSPIDDSTLHIDIVHATTSAESTKPLIGSAKIHLRDVVGVAGLGSPVDRKLELKRPSGRPHGKVEVKVSVREPSYRAPDPYYPPPYGVPQSGSRDYPAPPYGAPTSGTRDYPPPTYGSPYGAPTIYAAPPAGYPAAYGAPPSIYGQRSYGQAAAYGQGDSRGQGQQSYGQVQQSYGHSGQYGQQGYVEEKKKSKFGGMGGGLAVGALAGVLGGVALMEGFDALEDKIADKAADRVEDDDDYDGDDY